MIIHPKLMQKQKDWLAYKWIVPLNVLHSLSAFKSSSKFSEDFIFHLPEKSGIVFSIVTERRNYFFFLIIFCRRSHRARSRSPPRPFAPLSLTATPMCAALSSARMCASIDWLSARQAVMVAAREGLSALTRTAASTSGSRVRDVDTSWGRRRRKRKKALPVIALNDDELSGYEENVLIDFRAERWRVAGVRVNLVKCPGWAPCGPRGSDGCSDLKHHLPLALIDKGQEGHQRIF